MSKLHLLQPIDLKRYHSNPDGTLEYDRAPVDRERHCFFRLPMDFPGYARVLRIVDKEPIVTGREGGTKAYTPLGATLELDMFTFGVKVFLRVGRDGTLKLFAEDGEGRELLSEWSRD